MDAETCERNSKREEREEERKEEGGRREQDRGGRAATLEQGGFCVSGLKQMQLPSQDSESGVW